MSEPRQPGPGAGEPLVVMTGISKDFSGVRVLHDVNLNVNAGEVHALIGENGAGKSTLMKILAGYQPATGGSIRLSGQPVHWTGIRDAEAHGIVLIHQEFNLAEHLSVEENINLGHETGGFLLDARVHRERAAQALALVGVNLDPRTRVRDLIVPQRQMVEIAKALGRQARVLIMDEPTATLTPTEVDTLFALIGRLKAQGVTVLYISHKLGEVERISDTVTVLRDGRHVTTQPTSSLSQQQMANLMVGRELEDMYPPKAIEPDAEVVLDVRDVTVPGWAHGASFQLRRGEVLGFAGLVGAGRTELFEGLMGLRAKTGGTVSVKGQSHPINSPRDATRAGLVYLSEDRKGKGLHTDFGLRPNLTLMALDAFARPLLDVKAEDRALADATRAYNIRAPRSDLKASMLSGGNQQKLAMAKVLAVKPEIIVLDEPTRGVDVGAKREIYFLIAQLAASGKSVVVISSEMPELLGLAHRVIVMHHGEVTGELSGEQLQESEIIQYATGLKRQPQKGLHHVSA
ncbi:MAG TPA: sugar ABC transporter ATP-binding protein [Deinococcales bacterium]|nr:sugar ABC transporter ATP-binding protein [Deinococcales bacterium]